MELPYKICMKLIRRHWSTVVLALCVVYIYISFQDLGGDETGDGFDKSSYLQHGLAPDDVIRDGPKCTKPLLVFMPDEFRSFYDEEVKFACLPEPNLIDVYQGKIVLLKIAKDLLGEDLDCSVTPIKRKNDYIAKYDLRNRFKLDTDTNPAGYAISDFMKVKCSGYKTNIKYENLHLTVVPKPNLPPSVGYPSDGLGVDVLIFGFDSVSSLSWQRNLPLSHKFFTETMGGVQMESYNIVGDGTPQNLMPILMGHSELELPEIRKGYPGAKALDDLPWIWKDFKKAGYVTQWGEDSPQFGTFQYRMMGYKEPPVDHYMRPFQMVVDEEKGEHPPLCLKHKTQFQYMIDYIKDMWVAYPDRPKMTFMFHSLYSHDSMNKLKIAEHEFLTFLRQIHTDKIFRNTLVILMSDHGQRSLSGIRQTLQGKYEERLPYFAISLPKELRIKNPSLYTNLQSNSHTLTSPFDVHATMKDVIKFDQDQISKTQRLTRGMSMLRPMPKGRTCQHAQIAPHWCTCLHWQKVTEESDDARAATWALLKQINELTQDHRKQCEELHLAKIIKVELYSPDPKLVKFVGSIDTDGRWSDFDDSVDVKSETLIQVTVQTTPNSGMYEATIKKVGPSQYEVDTSQISRINRYGDQPHCVMKKHPHLRPYCFCKHQKPKV